MPQKMPGNYGPNTSDYAAAAVTPKPAVSRRSRRRTRPQQRQLPAGPSPASEPQRPPAESERLLLDQIAAGELDPHLTAIADAIHARHALLETIKSAKALAMLNVGDRV